ncbi:multidrug effflux MFS transporter [Allopontixanthobacter sp.]|uniref:multidrug effflux MFS transporter n=1 Tax=Allopontixanthobacter sp. TaxID=2906452 RepID=UPI002ABCB580|nr:multidrug effflux MFS transporter [Allopontixanthobacter sp.]MDZ4307530.1 multidrug effflux MFS transporter [Allopontixanthobacter sp.]
MTTSASPTRPQLGERELIAMMASLMSLQAFGIDGMLPALGAMAAELGASGNDRQLIIAAYLLGSGLGALIPGAFADRFGRRPVLYFSIVFYFLMSLACSMVTDFGTLVAMRAIQGFGSAGLSVLPATIVRDRVGGDRMAKLMSLIMMTFMVVPLLAPAAGQAILVFAGWRVIFDAMAVACALVGIWVFWRLPESLTAENRQTLEPRTIAVNMVRGVSDRSALGYILGSALVFGALFGFLNSSQQLIGETFGAGEDFALVFGAMVIGLVIANFTNSRIVERFGARRVSHTALLAIIVVSGVQVWSASQPDQSLWQFVPLMSINLALLGFIGANFGSIAMQPFLHIAGAASSGQTFLRMVTGALLGGAIGQAFDGTARPIAMALLVCGILALLLVLWSEKGRLFRRVHPPGTNPVILPAE